MHQPNKKNNFGGSNETKKKRSPCLSKNTRLPLPDCTRDGSQGQTPADRSAEKGYPGGLVQGLKALSQAEPGSWQHSIAAACRASYRQENTLD
jgi:hypothetical protein